MLVITVERLTGYRHIEDSDIQNTLKRNKLRSE